MWAPWRIEYVRAEKTGECPFCAAARDPGGDASLVVDRGEHCFTMLNAYPYASGHLMVCPYRHVGPLEDLMPAELAELMTGAQKAVVTLGEVLTPQGFNVGLNLGPAAGAGLAEHLHLHVVPRWEGDTNFMAVIGGTHVLPQALSATRELLAAVYAQPR